jgi:hypothetical protein
MLGNENLGQEQTGALDLGGAPQEQVTDRRDCHEQVGDLVLSASEALNELCPATLETNPDRVSLRVHCVAPLSSCIPSMVGVD